jgi:putative ABC transport system ATP-binding protein
MTNNSNIPTSPAFIELKHAVKKYGQGNVLVHALNDTNLTLPQGEISVVLGPSGCGKSTLLNMIGGLDALDGGELTIGGRRITGLNQNELTEYRRADIGFVFQFYNLIRFPYPQKRPKAKTDLASE